MFSSVFAKRRATPDPTLVTDQQFGHDQIMTKSWPRHLVMTKSLSNHDQEFGHWPNSDQNLIASCTKMLVMTKMWPKILSVFPAYSSVTKCVPNVLAVHQYVTNLWPKILYKKNVFISLHCLLVFAQFCFTLTVLLVTSCFYCLMYDIFLVSLKKGFIKLHLQSFLLIISFYIVFIFFSNPHPYLDHDCRLLEYLFDFIFSISFTLHPKWINKGLLQQDISTASNQLWTRQYVNSLQDFKLHNLYPKGLQIINSNHRLTHQRTLHTFENIPHSPRSFNSRNRKNLQKVWRNITKPRSSRQSSNERTASSLLRTLKPINSRWSTHQNKIIWRLQETKETLNQDKESHYLHETFYDNDLILFKMYSTSKDGNYFFRSISFILFNTEDHHRIIRQQTLQFIKQNPKKFESL